MRVFFLSLWLMGLGITAVWAQDTASMAVLNDFYGKLRGLSRPVEVRSVDMMTDGGTIAVTLAGPDSADLEFCLNEYLSSGDRGALFVNGRHVKSPEAVKVPAGSDLEVLIVDLLEEWISARAEVPAAYRQYISALLQRVSAHRMAVQRAVRQGGVTREKAVSAALKKIQPLLASGYRNVSVREEEGRYTVVFEGIPFVDPQGVAKESDMGVDVSRDTGEVLSVGAVDVRERK